METKQIKKELFSFFHTFLTGFAFGIIPLIEGDIEFTKAFGFAFLLAGLRSGLKAAASWLASKKLVPKA